jgi:RNA polymerase sigma-70 factor (ECF subfamily)
VSIKTLLKASGDTLGRDAFDRIYRQHAPSAFRRARRLLGNDADAYEVVHDVFVSLIERPEQYAAHSALTTFLYSAVTHACLNRLRNRGARLRLLRERFAGGLLARPRPQTPEASSVLRSVLERMPAPLAEVAVYYYADGLSHADIARILGCSRRQVGNHVSRLAQWASKQELQSCRT